MFVKLEQKRRVGHAGQPSGLFAYLNPDRIDLILPSTDDGSVAYLGSGIVVVALHGTPEEIIKEIERQRCPPLLGLVLEMQPPTEGVAPSEPVRVVGADKGAGDDHLVYWPCPGIKLPDGNYSGCEGGTDCPVCKGNKGRAETAACRKDFPKCSSAYEGTGCASYAECVEVAKEME